MAVRLLRCHAFTDAPDSSVVLCFQRGREVRVVHGGREEVEEEGEEGSGGGRRGDGLNRKGERKIRNRNGTNGVERK